MNAIATIITPGLQTTIQDMGRRGARHLGVPQSGAADRLSLALANIAIGNHWATPGLECTLAGPTMKFLGACSFAITGADMNATLNSAPVAMHKAHTARPGDTLSLGTAALGVRSTIAFSGGLTGDQFLQSRATYLPARLGGIEGRALLADDVLHGGSAPTGSPQLAPTMLQPKFSHDWVLRATQGPEAVQFGDKTLRRFFSQGFVADKRSDRIGMRLRNHVITTTEEYSMNSSAAFPGTVQAPPDGAPFLLLTDAQTTGGYPRIAQVIDADLDHAGQIRPGDKVWFRMVDADEALKISTQRLALIRSVITDFSFS